MTPDDPDLAELRAALDAATPRPDSALRAAHLRLAQENFGRLQGGAPASEGLLSRARQGFSAMLGALTGRGGLTAATALAACGFLVLTPVGQGLWQRPFAPVEREEATAAAPEPREPPRAEATESVPEIVAPESAPQVEKAPEATAGALRSEPEARDLAAPASSEAAPESAMTGPAGATEAERSAPESRAAGEALQDEPTVEAQDASSAEAAQGVPEGASPAMAVTEPAVAPQTENIAPESQAALRSGPAPEAAQVPSEAAALPPAVEAAPEQPLGATAEIMASPDSLGDETAAAPLGEAVPTVETEVDAAFAALRRSLREGRLPKSVRIEDLVNRFPYDLAAPGEKPTVSVLPTPWNPATRLVVVQIGGLSGEPGVIARNLQAEAEWNPATVAGSRPIREAPPPEGLLNRVKAGTLGAGRSVTMLFEVTPVGEGAAGEGLGTLRLRWTDPASGAARLLEVPITGREPAGTEARFAAAVAHWGLLLQGRAEGWDEAIALAEASRGQDPLRAEAIELMRLSRTLAR